MRLALPLTLCSHQAVTANSLLEPTRTSTLVRSAQRCVGLIVRFRAAAVSAMGRVRTCTHVGYRPEADIETNGDFGFLLQQTS